MIMRAEIDVALRINALFTVTAAATGIARVTHNSHNWEEDRTILPISLLLTLLCHFQLELLAQFRVTEDEFSALVTLVAGWAWDGHSDSNGAPQKLSFDASTPPDILADLNEKSLTQSNLAGLSRFRSQSLSEQQGPAVGWKFIGSDNIWGWHVKRQGCDIQPIHFQDWFIHEQLYVAGRPM